MNMTLKEFRIQRALGTLKFKWTRGMDNTVDIFLDGKWRNIKVNYEGHFMRVISSRERIKKILLDAVEKTLI